MYQSGKTNTLWNYLLLAGQRRTSETLYKGALRMWLRLSVCNRQGLAVLVLSLALIHPSAWNRNFANFAFWRFCELRVDGVLRSSYVACSSPSGPKCCAELYRTCMLCIQLKPTAG